MNQENERFEYTYSGQKLKEIQKIKNKYVSKEEDKYDYLKKLDQSVTRKGTVWSITVGIIGCLCLGIGMSCTIVFQGPAFIPGLLIGILGLVLIAISYPLYRHIVKKERERIAPQIIALADELISK